jgi:fatty-acyl-CoA synthase
VPKHFLAIDIKRGDRVGICASNCVEWLIVQIATAKIGAILVNINQLPNLRTGICLKSFRLQINCNCGQNKYADYSQMLYELIRISKAIGSLLSRVAVVKISYFFKQTTCREY